MNDFIGNGTMSLPEIITDAEWNSREWHAARSRRTDEALNFINETDAEKIHARLVMLEKEKPLKC